MCDKDKLEALRTALRNLVAMWRKEADVVDDGSGITACARRAQHWRVAADDLDAALHASELEEK